MSEPAEEPKVVEVAVRAEVVDVVHCARCGGDHPGTTFTPLTNPSEFCGLLVAWWASCPANGEPIFMTAEIPR
jgi:hypothetical protein